MTFIFIKKKYFLTEKQNDTTAVIKFRDPLSLGKFKLCKTNFKNHPT